MVKDPNGPTGYKFGARRRAPMASSPRIITQTGAVRRRSFEEKPIWLFIVPPRAQGSNPAPAKAGGAAKHQQRQAATPQALLAFPSPDPFPALLEPDRTRRHE